MGSNVYANLDRWACLERMSEASDHVPHSVQFLGGDNDLCSITSA